MLFVSRARGDRHTESGIAPMVIVDAPTPEPRSGPGVCLQEEQRLCFKPEAPGLGSTIVPVPLDGIGVPNNGPQTLGHARVGWPPSNASE